MAKQCRTAGRAWGTTGYAQGKAVRRARLWARVELRDVQVVVVAVHASTGLERDVVHKSRDGQRDASISGGHRRLELHRKCGVAILGGDRGSMVTDLWIAI